MTLFACWIQAMYDFLTAMVSRHAEGVMNTQLFKKEAMATSQQLSST